MADTAKLKIGDNSYEFPLIKGSENELAIDIKTLRGVSNGVITIDSGYKNTGACKSAITFLNGETSKFILSVSITCTLILVPELSFT